MKFLHFFFITFFIIINISVKLLIVDQEAKIKNINKEISEINSKISGLSTSFGQNLLAETNGFELILEASDLEGLSEGVIAAAADAASQKMDAAESDEEKDKYNDK